MNTSQWCADTVSAQWAPANIPDKFFPFLKMQWAWFSFYNPMIGLLEFWKDKGKWVKEKEASTEVTFLHYLCIRYMKVRQEWRNPFVFLPVISQLLGLWENAANIIIPTDIFLFCSVLFFLIQFLYIFSRCLQTYKWSLQNLLTKKGYLREDWALYSVLIKS